jgi:LETM1 and EF-hand domain-containing protein 1
MTAASLSSTLRSRSAFGLNPSPYTSIPLTPLQSRIQFRAITTETQRSTTSTTPPPTLAGAKNDTKVATQPPLSAAPPTPPLPISSIPPKIAEVAAEKVETAVKKNDKPKKGLPARAWAKVKEEASHYWHGTKLLGQEIKISAKLQYKVLQGQTLTRRERRQVSISPNGGCKSLTCNS